MKKNYNKKLKISTIILNNYNLQATKSLLLFKNKNMNSSVSVSIVYAAAKRKETSS